MLHRVYCVPGMFGFGKLGSYDYFAHVETALAKSLRAHGADVHSFVLDVPPTASIRRRAARLAELIARTSGDDGGPIHILGHSTGGLDARLVASPSAQLPAEAGALDWIPRLRSVTTMNTPHFGTPLASFFTTVSGQRMLYAISALTVLALTLGAPPLAAASALVVAIGRIDRMLGIELSVLDRATDALLKVLDETRSREVRVYLDQIRADQGSVVQVTPEAMDLFQAGVENRDDVLYQSTASMAPAPTPGQWLKAIGGAWSVISAPLFASLHGITSRYDERYPCAAADAGEDAEAKLVRAFGRTPGARANDGVVPLRSQLWGEVAWVGLADHLDVLGHYRGRRPLPGSESHVDWLTSGSGFDDVAFDALMRAISDGMLRAPQ